MAKKIRIKSKTVNRSLSGTVVLLVIMLIFAAFMVLPLVLAVSNSFKPLNELWEFPPKLYAKEPTLKNYIDMFNIMSGSLVPFTRYIFNTFYITIVGSVGHIIIASMCAYPLAKFKFKGKKLIFSIIVLSAHLAPAWNAFSSFTDKTLSVQLTDAFNISRSLRVILFLHLTNNKNDKRTYCDDTS